MKFFYTSFLTLSFLFSAWNTGAQVIFNETFDGISGSTAGGPGTYAFPAGWTLANVDNRAPAASVAYVNEAWERREDFQTNVSDSCAFSTSWYNPVGAANDFMWTPAINLAAGLPTHKLTWRAKAYDPAYADGYEVRIMTVAPTGTIGVIGNMLTNSTVIFSIAAENSSWTSREYTIPASYNGGSVYIGFRNNSTDKFILAIDDVKLERLLPFDAQTTIVNNFPYSIYPSSQATALPLGGTIRNAGTSAITNVNLGARVLNSANSVVFSTSGTAVASLAPAATQPYTLPSFNATSFATGNYSIKYFPTLTETDLIPVNDTLQTSVTISDTIYARDNGDIVGSLGIGAGNGGYLGQTFAVLNTAAVSSVRAVFSRGYIGRRTAARIWNADVAGKPTTVFADTDTLLYSSDDAQDIIFKIKGGPKAIPAGNYTVTAIEFDSTLALAQTSGIFTAGTTWVNWPTSPFPDWANNEAFGSSFAKSYMLRLNLQPLSVLPVKLISFTGVSGIKNNDLSWKVGEQFGIVSYDVQRSSDNRNFSKIGTVNASNASTDRYSFTDKDVTANYYYRLRINETGKPATYSDIVYLKHAADKKISISPNPVSDKAVIRIEQTGTINTMGQLFDASGKMVMQVKITSAITTIDMSILSKGSYIFKLESGQTISLLKL